MRSFAFLAELGEDLIVKVVVLFSCHCFTHARNKDRRCVIPDSEVFPHAHGVRILNAERYRLSRIYLPQLIRDLPKRLIRVATPEQNFVTMEAASSEGMAVHYAVFFDVQKDRHRKKCLLLRVQSAYPIQQLSARQRSAGKVNFKVLLKAAYAGRHIKG